MERKSTETPKVMVSEIGIAFKKVNKKIKTLLNINFFKKKYNLTKKKRLNNLTKKKNKSIRIYLY